MINLEFLNYEKYYTNINLKFLSSYIFDSLFFYKGILLNIFKSLKIMLNKLFYYEPLKRKISLFSETLLIYAFLNERKRIEHYFLNN